MSASDIYHTIGVDAIAIYDTSNKPVACMFADLQTNKYYLMTLIVNTTVTPVENKITSTNISAETFDDTVTPL